ncbi:glycine cleavage system protein H [Clostridiales Family XIII bacterium ASD5510]|uniref:Glycine cleavage system protein H n=1 Tax=Hominibacterium faecale TaxID=2839743 RepID=A0A9J6QP28_9FIRM|nr:putative zinc-binding protein [Hominibacterium faecale]MCU7378945.1 glycine cleavage system protein H [Hominibacterium faecale]
MTKAYAILPCNGLDKCAGSVSKEVAIQLAEQSGSEIICPVFFRIADEKYKSLTEEKDLLVVDGCPSRCASKLAAEKKLKANKKIMITEEAKQQAVKLTGKLRLNQELEAFAAKIVKDLCALEEKTGGFGQLHLNFPEMLHYQLYQKDKFTFQVPDNFGFYFNENDVWAYVNGTTARIGVTDFVQKSLSDILFFTPSEIGRRIEQFEDVGELESGKAVFEIISPVGGTITAVNERLMDTPELLNESPYEEGWIAEIELSDFENDRELLHDFSDYFPILKRKVDEFHV